MGGNSIAADNYEHVLRALDLGLNYLDTAPAYGNTRSETGYAQVLKARPRDRFFLNSKVSAWDLNRNKVFAALHASLSESEQKRLWRLSIEDIEQRQALAPDYVVHYNSGQKSQIEEAALANVMEKQYGRQIDRNKNYTQLILDSVDQTLARLGTDHLDLLMCPHGASSAFEVEGYPETFKAFERLKKAGKVRHFGVSAHNDPAGVLAAAVRAKIFSAAMVAYNVVNDRYVRPAIGAAHKAGLGVIAMKVARPVYPGNGRAASSERLKVLDAAMPGPLSVPKRAYLWALRNPSLTAVISEMTNAKLVEDNLLLAGTKA
jgi:aryl-alcohol dehydrogenase-like predicted oxidoreductase